jgi:hypothetical protein
MPDAESIRSPRFMVVRPASFQPYWAQPSSFGPMSEEEAKRMISSPSGGSMMTLEEWNQRHYV